LIGLAAYLFASSLVDLYGFINQIVGVGCGPKHHPFGWSWAR
jgi:hypothetical protein